MLKKTFPIGLLLIFIIGLNGCVNLKSVNNFSSMSYNGINKFEDIDYSFKRHCMDRCRFEFSKKLDIEREVLCECDMYIKADSVTLLLYTAIKGYLEGLTNLSNNELTSYNFDAAKKALTNDALGNIKIEKEQVEAYSNISKILLRASTDIYRKNKIKKYVEDANEPLQVLIAKFKFILQENLSGELDFRKERTYVYYRDIAGKPNLSENEKRKIVSDYYEQLSDINSKQDQINVFVKILEDISSGHQKLYDDRDKMTTNELKSIMTAYSSNIQDIISELNKLFKK